jgi:LacI family transcriptional regulator
VLEAARALGYTPNLNARALRQGVQRLIALVIWGQSHIYFMHYDNMKAILTNAFAHDYQVLALHVDRDTLASRPLPTIIRSTGAAGAIFMGVTLDKPGLCQLLDQQFPLVHIGERHLPGKRLPFASGDYYGGGALTATKLLAAGHARLGCLLEPNSDVPEIPERRATGFAAAVKEAGRAAALLSSLDRAEIAAWLKAEQITGLFCTSADQACSLVPYLSEQGWQIPQQLSIVAFDDHPAAPHLHPP